MGAGKRGCKSRICNGDRMIENTIVLHLVLRFTRQPPALPRLPS